jgi:hypothetical protein
LRTVLRDLNLGRDETNREVNTLIAQGWLHAVTRNGKPLEEVTQRNQRVLLRPAKN